MRMIAGFETPSSGDIRIKGESVLGLPPNRRNVKMVFQHLALFPMMNVGENIAYGLRCRGDARSGIAEKVARVLDRVGLPGVEEKRIEQLSGGQKQRIAIARCMVLEPDVLLLDEPLGALDLKLREQMQEELKVLQKALGITFVFVTHDQGEALSMADRIAVFNEGRIMQTGTPEDLYRNPATRFVAGFVGHAMQLPGQVVGGVLKTAAGDLALPREGSGCDVFVRAEDIYLSPTGPLRARVDSSTFLGTHYRLGLAGIGPQTLFANHAGLSAPTVGTDVGVAIDPAALMLLPRESISQ